jgi:hypothetical protein
MWTGRWVVATVSFDLMVVAAVPGADEAAARAVVERCFRGASVHVEGELDERIVGFYEDLRAVYPDFPPTTTARHGPAPRWRRASTMSS